MCNLMSKLKSALLFLLDYMWTHHKLPCNCLDGRQLLITHAQCIPGNCCVYIITKSKTICQFSSSAVILLIRVFFILRSFQSFRLSSTKDICENALESLLGLLSNGYTDMRTSILIDSIGSIFNSHLLTGLVDHLSSINGCSFFNGLLFICWLYFLFN